MLIYNKISGIFTKDEIAFLNTRNKQTKHKEAQAKYRASNKGKILEYKRSITTSKKQN